VIARSVLVYNEMNIQVNGPYADLALHTLGWKAFQDLCAQVCAESFNATVAVYREAQDGGQDAVFLLTQKNSDDRAEEATVQCKFTSKVGEPLRANALHSEIPAIKDLVKSGRAHSYYFITNLGVDAPVAAVIRDKLAALGVKQPYVLGREWITLEIRKSARLRALVPRVYGLGDLSVIVDERCADQTRALLGHLLPTLRAYVPTSAHRDAVRILAEHKMVLLLGAPATGKSMLASILATTAIDGDNHVCLKCDGPLELIARWNPHEKNRLYWIDDAFGSNQLRTDYIDSWVNAFSKMRAAVDIGNRFILTSRNHIWNAAKPRLGTRNMSLFEQGTAVVHVGSLSPEEREQILYNHLKLGNQPQTWKQRVKPFLFEVATDTRLLPEIARRLGDSTYTKALTNFPRDLVKFVGAPAAFLQETIRELSDAQQAALTLVFIWRSKLPIRSLPPGEATSVADKYGTQTSEIFEALPQLENTFLVRREENGEYAWSFIHPTFVDAITDILSNRPDLVDLYLRGAKLETLLNEALCDGAGSIRDAIIVPAQANDRLVERLVQTPDDESVNMMLFDFLRTRATDVVIREVVKNMPSIMTRRTGFSWRIRQNARLRLLARCFALGLLPEKQRLAAADELEYAVLQAFDASFLDDEELAALIPPLRLINLGARLVELLDDKIPKSIEEIADNADPNDDLDDHFDTPKSFLESLAFVLEADVHAQEKLSELKADIAIKIARILERKTDNDNSSWLQVAPAKITTTSQSRSIFSDVDE